MSEESKFTESDPFDQRIMGPLHTFDLPPQAAYERIRAYFTAPGAELGRSTDSRDGACSYRGVNEGRPVKCAVGCLIPDSEYDPIMDTGSYVMQEFENSHDEGLDYVATTIDTTFDDLHAAGVFSVNGNSQLADLLSAVQTAHDSSDSTEEFIDTLDRTAVAYGLKVLA